MVRKCFNWYRGYISRENAIEIVKDRTNHCNDKLIVDFWENYNYFAKVNTKVLNLIQKLKDNNYKIYLLSNINPYTFEFVNKSGLFDLVDGYVLSYQEHKVKPYKAIYNVLLKRYSLIPDECIFLDDNQNNIETGNSIGIISKKYDGRNECNTWSSKSRSYNVRNKYTYFASKAKKEGYEQIDAIFQETADNEKELSKFKS